MQFSASFGPTTPTRPPSGPPTRQTRAAQDPGTPQGAGLAGATTTAVVLFLAFYCGGYVAGRMTRFTGARQGLAVWLWTVAIGLVGSLVAAISGANITVPGGFSTLPINQDTLTTGGVIAALVALVGAVLGGVAGMRFHRKVDNGAFDTEL
ncbi:hypothetical protein [Actinokineospora bangkokensis]|uniref:Uncharacterized protein n=1 Tax=Actinokineospora bangkokensis TaxID=1193682 RepID=A0A1Q9LIT9_9PSEU|nr:hypothetical protein [Actinokineospora bangkokensis]OLR91948.1 hypothetical protein BJP25_24305 [Actinokineospora bangkokensis]